ncbi:hypothetical protein F4703DRAFT_1914657 [Phycomyces blakesleeanus]
MDRQEYFIDCEPSEHKEDFMSNPSQSNEQDSRRGYTSKSPRIKQYHAEEQMVFREGQRLSREEQERAYYRELHQQRYQDMHQQRCNMQGHEDDCRPVKFSDIQKIHQELMQITNTLNNFAHKSTSSNFYNHNNHNKTSSLRSQYYEEEQATFDYHNGERYSGNSNSFRAELYSPSYHRSQNYSYQPNYVAPDCPAAAEQYLPWAGARNIDLFTGLEHNHPFVTLPYRGYPEDERVAFCNQRQRIPVTDCKISYVDRWQPSKIRD